MAPALTLGFGRGDVFLGPADRLPRRRRERGSSPLGEGSGLVRRSIGFGVKAGPPTAPIACLPDPGGAAQNAHLADLGLLPVVA